MKFAVRQRRFGDVGAAGAVHDAGDPPQSGRPGLRPHYMIMLDKLRRDAHRYDILHFHIDAFHLPLFRDMAAKTVTTLHGRQDLPDLLPLYRAFPEMPLVSISNAQRAPIAEANFAKTIYHGLPNDLLLPNYAPRGGYLAFLGRMSPEKRPERAIAIASALGVPLKIAAKVDKVDEAYFREVIAPLLERPGDRIRRRDQRPRKAKVSRRRARAAVPDRLARAVRAGDDRGDGVRDADAGVPLRFGPGNHRSRRHWPRRRQRRRSNRALAAGDRPGPARRAAALRRALFGGAQGRPIYRRSIGASHAAPRRVVRVNRPAAAPTSSSLPKRQRGRAACQLRRSSTPSPTLADATPTRLRKRRSTFPSIGPSAARAAR